MANQIPKVLATFTAFSLRRALLKWLVLSLSFPPVFTKWKRNLPSPLSLTIARPFNENQRCWLVNKSHLFLVYAIQSGHCLETSFLLPLSRREKPQRMGFHLSNCQFHEKSQNIDHCCYDLLKPRCVDLSRAKDKWKIVLRWSRMGEKKGKFLWLSFDDSGDPIIHYEWGRNCYW